VYEDGQIVATSGAFSLDLAVPGASLPAGGTTNVTVRTTHRRRGLLTAMMRAHLEDVREREEPLAALWASESGIYPRFGYGVASYRCEFRVERVHADFAQPLAGSGRVRLVPPDEARKLLPRVYDQVWRERPGHFARSDAWWEHRRLYDPEWDRQGSSKLRYGIYEVGGEPRGYAQYRVRQDYTHGIATGTVSVIEIEAVDAEATAAVWRHVLDVDLMKTVHAWGQPLDDPLPWLVADTRRVVRELLDGIWVRVLDVPRALEGRHYGAEGRLVLEVHDPFWPDSAGRFSLETGADGARCRPSTETPDLTLSATELGAVYLGGTRFDELARAGRIEGASEPLRRADAMFATQPLPWCPEVF
jgi:predicted acetyltransferase